MQMARAWILVLAAAWLCAIAISVLTFLTTAPTGDGFTSGLNRAMVFLGWQAGALILAVLVAIVTLRLPRPRDATVLAIGLVPGFVSVMMVLTVGAFIAWAALSPPPSVDTPPPAAPTEVPAN